MTSLYIKATPSQRRVLRAVEGAVFNAHHAHPEWAFDQRLARSIAKRAAGTLTAQWSVLASAGASDMPEGTGTKPSGAAAVSREQPPTHGLSVLGRRGRGSSRLIRRSPLRRLWGTISHITGEAKRAGQTERAQALIDVLRLIDEQR